MNYQTEVNGMRLKQIGQKIVVGPMTAKASVYRSMDLMTRPISSSTPYPTDWLTWRQNLINMFGLFMPIDCEVVSVKYLNEDKTLIVAEFKVLP